MKPRVLLSKCLGYEACRYNGQKLEDDFVRRLAPFVSYELVCPEVEIGLGTPRPPVRLVTTGGGLRMVQPETRRDVTRAMSRFASRYVSTIDEVDGAILKGRSPSCGLRDAKRYRDPSNGPSAGKGAGLFAAAVLERFPDVAIEDEGRLKSFRIREHFLTKLFLRSRFRSLAAGPTAAGLVRFQAENKLLLMAYNQKEMRELGRLVASHGRRDLHAVMEDYTHHLAKATARAPRHTSNINVMMHALGYFSKELSSPEKRHFLELLDAYRDEKVPLSAVVAVCRSWIARFSNDYLARQTFFDPYPVELVEITDSGKGRDRRRVAI